MTRKTRYNNLLRKTKGEGAGHKTYKLLQLNPNKKDKSPNNKHTDMNKKQNLDAKVHLNSFIP